MRDFSPLFVGRAGELERLSELRRTPRASLAILRGRRRIGKSRLAVELARRFSRSYVFTGLAPTDGVTAALQRKEFARQLQRELGVPSPAPNDFGDLFAHLAHHTRRGSVLIVLDEISWLGAKDPTFLPKLKTAWDLQFSNNPKLVMILAGSVSTWIEANILSSTGFVGRISLDLRLAELPLPACAAFWGSHAEHVSAYEMLKVLAITGGVPRYLEEVIPTDTAEQNIERLCFRREGLLFGEFDRIFSDLFSRRAPTYRAIVERLAQGSADAAGIYEALGVQKGGITSAYLDDLCEAGFVARDYTWSLQSGNESRLSKYRLSDNYLRFYLRYIAPNRRRIERGSYRLPRNWHSILGLQFESLVLHNRARLQRLLRIEPSQIVYDGPFFQRKTRRRRGCQIDYLIQTRFDTLYLCEIKFHKSAVGASVIDDVHEKMRRLSTPRRCSVRPVLIHVNGVTDEVTDSEEFAAIIDYSTLLRD